jgi:hypothetical protein
MRRLLRTFFEDVRKETGYPVDRSMVVAIPDWDLINNPKQPIRTRRLKKVEKILFEEPATEAEQQGGNDEVGKDRAEGTSERQEAGVCKKDKDVDVQKERRTKKRSERPSSSDDDDHFPLSAKIPTKRQKAVASKPPRKPIQATKGKFSETNVFSTS